MTTALALGRRGQGRVWPNPAVGCVIVRGDRVVGRGWTQNGGRPHAETVALAQAGKAAQGATAYVTLEPCSHHGQTPPCADALITAGVARVVVATGDPDPKVNGQGLARLRAAGITVQTGVCEEEARRDHAGFFLRVGAGRPLVTLKLAASFDGRIATATGESKWISGPAARHAVHQARATHDLVLVGGGTVRADNPRLSVRGMGPVPQPVRAVVSRRLSLPQDLAMLADDHGGPVWLIHDGALRHVPAAERDLWAKRGARLLPIDAARGAHLDPNAVLAALAEAGITRVFCEGGGQLAASLLSAGLVDRLIGVTAGVALGAEGRPAIGALGVEALDAAPRYVLSALKQVGADVIHEWETMA